MRSAVLRNPSQARAGQRAAPPAPLCSAPQGGRLLRLPGSMAEREGYNQIYRQSQLGLSLQSALEDLDDQIDPSLRQKVFNHFDRVRTHDAPSGP